MASLDGGIGDAYVSPQIEASLGFSQGEWLEDPIRWYEHIHPDDKERWSTEAAEMFVSGNTPEICLPGDRTRWQGGLVSMRSQTCCERGWPPYAPHGVGFDITNLKESEQALCEKNKQLELLKDIATTANQATSVAEAMQFAVDRICEFTGWPLGHAFIALRPEGSGSPSIWNSDARASFRCIPCRLGGKPIFDRKRISSPNHCRCPADLGQRRRQRSALHAPVSCPTSWAQVRIRVSCAQRRRG